MTEPPTPPQVHRGRLRVLFTAQWSPVCAAAAETCEPDMCVDVDQWPHLAETYRIFVVPTLLNLNEGEEEHRTTGVTLVEKVKND